MVQEKCKIFQGNLKNTYEYFSKKVCKQKREKILGKYKKLMNLNETSQKFSRNGFRDKKNAKCCSKIQEGSWILMNCHI